MPRQTQLLMHGKAVKPLDLSVADVGVGENGQGNDARCGLFMG